MVGALLAAPAGLAQQAAPLPLPKQFVKDHKRSLILGSGVTNPGGNACHAGGDDLRLLDYFIKLNDLCNFLFNYTVLRWCMSTLAHDAFCFVRQAGQGVRQSLFNRLDRDKRHLVAHLVGQIV